MYNICVIYALELTKNNMFLIAGIAILAAVTIFLLISFFLSIKGTEKYQYKIKDHSNSIRVFVLDVKNNRATFFNNASLKKRRYLTLTEYYNEFPASEREKLISWIGNLLDKTEDTPNTLEINVVTSNNKKRYFTLLELKKIDYEKQLIHLESHLLKYLTVSRGHYNEYFKFSSESSFSRSLKTRQTKGYVMCFKFFLKKNFTSIPHLHFVQIKNSLVPYISNNRLMYSYSDNAIFIADFKATNHGQALQTMHLLEGEINRRLSVNGILNDLEIHIGIVENKKFVGNLDKIIEVGLKLTEVAKKDEITYAFYREDNNINVDDMELNYRTEVERIIHDKKLQYTYRPIIDVSRRRTLGYQSFVTPLDSFFDSINELKNYASKTNDDKELFTTIARNCISRFIQQKDGNQLRLFFDVSYNELALINRTLAHIQNIKETHVVVVIKEQDIIDLPPQSNDSVIAVIKSLKSNGYQVALTINETELRSSANVYETFDYFILAPSPEIIKRSASRSLPIFKKFVETLLKYHRPIITENMVTWEQVELMVRLGLDIVSSDVIAPQDENVLPVAYKTMMKLENFTK